MSYEEFSSIENIELPQVLLLESESKKLLYFGSYHSNEKTDTIFHLIRDEWNRFEPDFVLHEGGSNWPIYKDIDSTILISGEPGFIIQLSKEQNVQFASIEAPEEEEYQHLLEKYEFDWVVLMYLCRQIDQQKRLAEANKTTEDEFVRNMDYFLRMLNEKGIDLEENQQKFSYWKAKYQELLKEELVWREFNAKNYYPNFYLSQLNEINRASDQFRNEYMVEKIFNQLAISDKVFVVVGGGHLIIQEALIRHQFKKLAD